MQCSTISRSLHLGQIAWRVTRGLRRIMVREESDMARMNKYLIWYKILWNWLILMRLVSIVERFLFALFKTECLLLKDTKKIWIKVWMMFLKILRFNVINQSIKFGCILARYLKSDMSIYYKNNNISTILTECSWWWREGCSHLFQAFWKLSSEARKKTDIGLEIIGMRFLDLLRCKRNPWH